MASGDVFGMGQEGHSIVRPPLFNGEDYAYWKTRMRLFVQANDYQVWRIIMSGPLIPTKKVDDHEVPKEEWEGMRRTPRWLNSMLRPCTHFFMH